MDTIKEIQQKTAPILKKHDVVKAALFGSFARNEMDEESDLDTVVDFNGEKSLIDLVDLKIDLENTLHVAVDVVTFNGIHPLLKKKIEKDLTFLT